MLLYLLVTFFTFIVFLKSLSLKPLPQWASGMRLMSFWFWNELPPIVFSGLINNHHTSSIRISSRIVCRKRTVSSRMENAEMMSVLDLPELALECILEKLPPSGLLSLAGVCNSLKVMCRSDHLWERHMKQKWGRVIGPAAFREWQWHIATENDSRKLKQGKQNALLGFVSLLWPFSWFKSRVVSNKKSSSLPVNSTMFWYLALENGKFWFPAQVYNRENGHVGFMLSCYDAELCYDAHTDTFKARYPPHGRRAIAVENGVTWDRLRAPPVETPPHDLHVSDCLNQLRPGDHIEIQWRRNKDFPYGWWYGVVGHMESCDGNESYCRCHDSADTVVLEFNQYSPGSRWRCSLINRKDHREEGNEADGFYGGLRKLKNKDEIAKWKCLWPDEVLE